mgnify:CR=1 FL=1
MFELIPHLAEGLMILSIVGYLLIYLVGIRGGTVKPLLATWAFLGLATFLSVLTTFGESGVGGLVGNLYNIVDASATVIILIVVFFSQNTRRQFNRFEKVCLLAVLLVSAWWLWSGQNIAAHLALQLILVIAYLPTLVHLWWAKVNTESLAVWSLNCLAAVVGLIKPLQVHDFLPTVYGVRAVVSTLAVMALIWRLKYKERQKLRLS